MGKAQSNEEYYRSQALRALKSAGKIEALIKQTTERLAANPDAVRVLTDLWHYHTADGDHEKASEYAERVVKLRPDDAKVRYQFASALLRADQSDKAFEHFEAILNNDPALLIGGNRTYDVIRAFRQAGQLDRFAMMLAEKDWNKLSRSRNVNPDQLGWNLIRLAEELGRSETAAALPFFDKLNDYTIDDSQNRHNHGRVVRHRAQALLKPRSAYVRTWHMVAPFPCPDDGASDKAYPPETTTFAADQAFDGAHGKVSWKPIEVASGLVDGGEHLPVEDERFVAYAHCELQSTKQRTAATYMSGRNVVTIWVNGKEVYAKPVDDKSRSSQGRCELPLEEGNNSVLLKLMKTRSRLHFGLRVAEPDDETAQAQRQIEAMRYMLASSMTFKAFTLQRSASVPREAFERPLLVRTQRTDLLTTIYSWSHPNGSPNGMAGELLDIAAEAEQLDPMRAYLESQADDDGQGLKLGAWLAMINCRLGRLDAVKAAVPELLELAGKTTGNDNRNRQGNAYSILWLDSELAKHDELRAVSLICCEFVVDSEESRAGSGLANLFYHRLADRYFKNDQREAGRAALLELANMKIDTRSYPGTYGQERQQENKVRAAEGLNKAGFYADAYKIALEVSRHTIPGSSRRYYVQQAETLLKQIGTEHPEFGALLYVATTPVAKDQIQIVWSTACVGGDIGDRPGSLTQPIEAAAELFAGYHAEIQVSAAQTGGFRPVALEAAEKQHYLHGPVPANRLFWYRVVLRDAEGHFVVRSKPVPAATGENLVPDGAVEATALGPIQTAPDDDSRPWAPTDLEDKPREGYAVVEGGRPFSLGARSLVGRTGGREWFAASRPFRVDPSKNYVMGGWMRTLEGDGVLARIALDDQKRTLALFELNWIDAYPSWCFVVQRLTQDPSLKVMDGPGKIQRYVRYKTDRMPESQAYLRLGCLHEGASAIDDAFLIEYTVADAALVGTLVDASLDERQSADAPLHDEAARRFREHVGERVLQKVQTTLLTAVPVSEHAVQLAWAAQPSRMKTRDELHTMRHAIAPQPELFSPYTVEAYVSGDECGDYHLLAEAEGAAQTFTYENAPPNTVLWYKIVLRDDQGRVAAVSHSTLAAAGTNLLADGEVERVEVGPLAQEGADDPGSWRSVDRNLRPRGGLAAAAESRPFSAGKRCLLAKAESGGVVQVCSRPTPAGPNDFFFYGAWVRPDQGPVHVGRLAHTENRTPLLNSVAWKVSADDAPGWMCVIQRTEPERWLEVTPEMPPKHMQGVNAQKTPPNQRFLELFITVEGTAAIDDAFMIRCHAAGDPAILSALPPAGDLYVDLDAAKEFAERVRNARTPKE